MTATINTVLIAPAGSVGAVLGLSGNSYAIDVNGFVTITAPGDVKPLLDAGYRFAAPLLSSQAIGADGLSVSRMSFTSFSNSDGSALSASASAGKFGFSITLGTLIALVGEAAEGNTKTDTCLVEAVVGSGYNPADPLTVTVNAQLLGTGTAGTKTIGVAAYPVSPAGVMSANAVSTSAQAISATATDYLFTIPANTLTPGQRVILAITATIQETGGTATITGQVNSVRFS